MNHKRLIGMIALALAGTAVAAAPQPDSKRVDSAIMQMMQQTGRAPADIKLSEVPAEIRKQVETQLQAMEVLKAEALKAGLDKQPDIQVQLQNIEAQFYAAKYAEYLADKVEVSEADLRNVYNQTVRTVKLQQVAFDSAEQAAEAQKLLLKGLSFDELMKRYPNPDQNLPGMVRPQQLPPELAQAVSSLQRGEVSKQPVAFGGRFYLLKVAAEERDPQAKPFEQVKEQLLMQAKQQKADEQINSLLKANGVELPQ